MRHRAQVSTSCALKGLDLLYKLKRRRRVVVVVVCGRAGGQPTKTVAVIILNTRESESETSIACLALALAGKAATSLRHEMLVTCKNQPCKNCCCALTVRCL